MRRPAAAFLAASLLFGAAAGCGAKDEAAAVETKPSEVKVNLDQGTQDRLAADLKNFTPDKKK